MNELNVESLALERFYLGNVIKLLEEDFPQLAINAQIAISKGADMSDPLCEMLTASIKTWMLKAPHPAKKVLLHAPANWWEAFKDRWFPYFLKKKFPVKWGMECQYEYGPIYLCPHSNHKWPNGSAIHLQWLKDGK